jgi:hypothetical protein
MITLKVRTEVVEVVAEPKKETANQRYYKANKEALNKAKKLRYENDPDYKKSVLERSQARWLEKIKKDPAAKMLTLDEIPYSRNYMRLVFMGDKRIRFYSLGGCAKALGISGATIGGWHSMEILPIPAYAGTDGRRWYSEVYIENVREVLIDRRYADLEALKANMMNKFSANPDVMFTGRMEMKDEDMESIRKMFA